MLPLNSLSSADFAQHNQHAPVVSITPYTYHYLFGLLATTGMRVSEVVALLESDLTKDGLLIRETKFHKSRLVPIHPTTRKALSEYLALRRRIGGPDPHLFVISLASHPIMQASRGRSSSSPVSWACATRKDGEHGSTTFVTASRSARSNSAAMAGHISTGTCWRSAPVSGTPASQTPIGIWKRRRF